MKRITLLAPVFNEEAGIKSFLKEIQSVVSKLKKDYEFEVILVDDGSTDNTFDILSKSRIKAAKMKIIRLASNSGHQAALMAGIVETQGDCLIMMDADLQHPPDNVLKFISGWKEGFEIVQGVRTETQEISLLKQVTSLMFYKVFNLFSSSKIKQGSSDFRLLDKVVYRQIQQLLIKSPNRDFMLRALLPSLNCKTQYIEFSSPKRLEGKSSYTKMKMIRLAFSGFISYSKFPMVFISMAITLYLIFLIGYSLVITSLYFTSRSLPPGITSLVLLVTISTLIQLTASLLILLICYRIYQEKISLPRFIVKSRKILE